MKLHSIIAYMKYRMRAKARHGIHSPFVYGFIEQVLMNPETNTDFQGSISAYTGKETILQLQQPEYWAEAMAHIKGDTAVYLYKDIYATAERTKGWESVCRLPHVKLSIDIYTYGVLFFSDAFKEKQHFVLKYPYK